MKQTKAPMTMRAAAYIRVSSEEQVEGHSLDAQRRAITAACAERGWEIVAWYADEGVSAHTDEVARRPAFHQMITDAQRRRFDAVVVHKLDRFARSVVVALSTFKLLNSLGISFLSLSEQGMDFTTPMGRVMLTLLASFAEYYSENLGFETKKGKAERRAQGLHNGLVPFGYRSVDGGVAEPHPETQAGARLAFELAANGKSLRDIAQALNARGYRTAGNMRRGVFTKDTVRDMLGNRFYLGELPVFVPGTSRRVREWEAGKHAALIEVTTFEAARAAIKGRATAGKTRRDASVYSLSGLLRCVHCGERLRAVHNKGDKVRYYCRSHAQGLPCPGKGSFLDIYEQQVVADLAAFELPDEWKQTVFELNRSDETRGDDVETQRQQLTARLARVKDLYAWGDLTREQYQVERDRIERTLAQLQPLERPADQLDALATYLQSLPTAWADADQRQRNEMAAILYEEVWVDGPRVEYVKPRPELEPLFQTRTGAAQPAKVSIQGDEFSSGDPDGCGVILSHYHLGRWHGIAVVLRDDNTSGRPTTAQA